MLDDYGQKWKDTPAQFELNHKFARAHNPTDDIMTVGPDIYDNYKHLTNPCGETIVYKRDCGQLVPKPTVTSKTDWRDGSVVRSSKTKKQTPHHQMVSDTAPPLPADGRGGPCPPPAVPIVAAVIVP